MAVCVSVSGSYLAVNSTAIGSCTDYVLQTASEYAVTTPPITVSDANELAWAVVAVWALAYAIKVLRRAL